MSMTKDIKRVLIALDLYLSYLKDETTEQTTEAIYEIVNASKYKDIKLFLAAITELTELMENIKTEGNNITGDDWQYRELLSLDDI